MCFGLIAHGPTFCIKKNCKVAHAGGLFDVKHNTICVIKSNDMSLFCEPISSRDWINETLFQLWKEDKVTLGEWTERFAFAGSLKEVLTDAALKASEDLQEAAKNFKTLSKISQKSSDEEIQEMLALMPTEDLYKRKIVCLADVDKIKTADFTFLSEVIQGMEEKLDTITRKTSILDASSYPFCFPKH
jgi:hypothetical protein